MFTDKTEEAEVQGGGKRRIVAELANVTEEIITALILALLLVVFLARPYIIPTGSMADTLKGAHFRLRCLQCGYDYDVNFMPRDYGLRGDVPPRFKIRLGRSRCPNCGFYQLSDRLVRVSKGDKIVAAKCIYQFFEPNQWDVVVFKSPVEPKVNFIKRLVARPGETVEIVDGDVYIDGQISRKPKKVQDELWMPIYNNDYQPVKPLTGVFNGHIWKQPFDVDNSRWSVDKNDPTQFVLNAGGEQISTLVYDTSMGNDFRATYAYDDMRMYQFRPYCSDLKLRLQINSEFYGTKIGIALSKYGVTYKGWVDSGDMVISKVSKENGAEELIRKSVVNYIQVRKASTLIEFANVDHQLVLNVGSERLVYDLGTDSDAAGERKTDISPQAKIFGAGELVISHVAIFRDIHYLDNMPRNGSPDITASEGNPLTLGEDEFFVLGDNSPASLDGRLWDREGIGNNGVSYRMGIVPREYLVGKAIAVFWPSGYRPVEQLPFALIPNIGKIRVIYGGQKQGL